MAGDKMLVTPRGERGVGGAPTRGAIELLIYALSSLLLSSVQCSAPPQSGWGGLRRLRVAESTAIRNESCGPDRAHVFSARIARSRRWLMKDDSSPSPLAVVACPLCHVLQWYTALQSSRDPVMLAPVTATLTLIVHTTLRRWVDRCLTLGS
ncbi:hypothetical protein F5Y10DRAFT_234903, partial [Nemania abortiva]